MKTRNSIWDLDTLARDVRKQHQRHPYVVDAGRGDAPIHFNMLCRDYMPIRRDLDLVC